MTRTYDPDRPEDLTATPVQIAHQRAHRFEDPLDQARFMDAFRIARIAEAKGHDIYKLFRSKLDEDDSVSVAGLIEGATSVHSPRGKVL